MRAIRRKLRQTWKAQRGEIAIEIIVGLIVGMIVVLNIIQLFGIFFMHQNIVNITEGVVRSIEIEGRYGVAAQERLAKMNEELGTNAAMEISNVSYFNSHEKTIQFRDTFDIKVSDTYYVHILSPVFSSEPVEIEIPITYKLTGNSEVYWKE